LAILDPSAWTSAIYGSPQELAAKEQSKQAAAYNAQQLAQFHIARGSEGSAILPEYLKAGEQQAGARAMASSRAIQDYYGTPAQIAARGGAISAKAMPLLDQGAASMYGIFSGDEERKRLAAAQPAFAARTALAGTTRAGALQGINERLAAIKAANASRGFAGAGSGSERLAFQAQIAGNQAGAGAEAAAALQNQMETEAIRNRLLDLQMQSPELAGQLAAQYANLGLLPAQYSGAVSRAEQAPYDYFRVGVGQPPAPVMAPWAQPNPNALLGAMGQDAQSAGRYFAQRDLANRYNQQNYNTGYRPYGTDPESGTYPGYGGPGGTPEGYGQGSGEGYYMPPDYSGYGSGAGDAAFAGGDLGY
jgi:hypothetical protein